MSNNEEIGEAGINSPEPVHNKESNVSEPPSYEDGFRNGHVKKNAAEAAREQDWATRNGLNFKSFQVRDYGPGIVELDRSMKSRHLHMIAIGELLCVVRCSCKGAVCDL